ncbi:MAG TPA: CoA-binding protein [Blastocatellia bacterium]|nr:CoA-binding protein [Blastocatellia bacterium]
MEVNSPEAISKILDETKTIAVVGLSSDPSRPSYGVSSYMQSMGYRVIPVNPRESQVLGEKAYASLADVPETIDLVNIFRRSDQAGGHIDEAISVGARAVWLQEGVIDHGAAMKAVGAGLDVVMDRCILKEHMRRKRIKGVEQ